ncbi:hypothetical protein BCR34DRAFT_196978 [Clohesyomyces aquaticus]|uniref:Uncharacterized protein n=1 Tax=Clohesyomyces aquaticus TaxID=1231657 RepID=A0A1Y1ZXQ0_9PLEO|nr:hypothetical protein BCR34DRAFT_196978 [Clohesyomyces aquaticus]
MFKPQILRRSFSVFNRIPKAQIVRSAAHNGHETVHIQRVRFKKPFFTRSRFISTAIATAGIYAALRSLGDFDEEEEKREQEARKAQKALRRKWAGKRPRTTEADHEALDEEKGEGEAEQGDEENEDDEEDEDEDEDEDEGEEDVEPLVFLPTGFSRKKQRTYYRGSDPEWQEFVRIAPNKDRVQRIQMELIGLVRQGSSTRPDYIRRLGEIDPQKGYWWIELKFPDGPPQEYERPGIEITDDLRYRWTTRSVNEIHHQRLNNVLVPTAVAKSIYVDTKKKVERSWLGLQKYVGWGNTPSKPPESLPPPPPPPPPPTQQQSPPAGKTSGSPTPPAAPANAPPAKESSSPSPPQTPATSRKEPQKEPETSTSLESSVYKRFGVLLPSPKTLTLDLSTFRRAFSRNQKPYVVEPPRGTFIVHGLVEVIGERAKLTLDVTAVYDPKVAQFVMFVSKLRSITDYRQEPRGGS